MRIAVVTPVMKSGERGGAEALYKGLVAALRRASFDADPIEVVIDESNFDSILESYQRCYDLDLRAYDQVISTKAPTYMVPHPNHVSYLLHTIRVFYDMFAHEYGAGTREQQQQRRLIQRLDKWGLHPDRVHKHFANGNQTFQRLYQADAFWRELNFEALHHPPALEGFHAPRRGEYIFMPSRLHRWKRVDLIIKAFAYLERNVKLEIAGAGEEEATLRELARNDPRIEFLGKVGDEQMLDLYAGTLVVPFVPIKEDYGLVTIEAFKSQKPVLTCTDSGEPLVFVKNGETGFVVEPDPRALAEKIDYLFAHPEHAAEMGRRGYASVTPITWDTLIRKLVDREFIPAREKKTLAWSGFKSDETYRVTVLDMQPIEPPIGGGRIRLLGLYHALGKNLPTTYIGTYDWQGEKYRRHQHTETLEEITVPLSAEHFAQANEWLKRAGGKNVIDVSFDLLAPHSPEFVHAVQESLHEADIVIFSHPWIYPLVKNELRGRTRLVVYDSQNVEALLRLNLLDDGAFGTELVKHVARVEYELCQQADLIFACSHIDRERFHELYDVPYAKILIVPNGAFTRQVTPADSPACRATKQALGFDTKPLALFVGSAYQPNVEAAEFILHTLAPRLPHIAFAVCGDVGRVLETDTLPANVRVTGRFDESEKRAYFAAADLAINPMFSGSGTNIKMFDFMAAGLPILATPIGARGIELGAEVAFEVCAESEFPDALRRLVQDDSSARRMGMAARRLGEEKYSWERISQQLGVHLSRTRSRLQKLHPFFSVIIASYERPDLLTQLMETLRAQTSRDFEIIIVDQSPTAWSDCERFADLDVLYLHTDVRGAVNARNTAAFYARGEVLAFTDDDCQPQPDWLENARAYFDDGRVVGIEGLILSDNREDPNYRAVTNLGFEGIGFMTANLFLRREIFNAIDGFDERFDHPHFREDTDLGWRACAHGEIPFGNDVRVYHPPHSRENERETHAERVRFFEKDALLAAKHPERYRALFMNEAHYLHTPGFSEHFLRGAEKYGVKVDDFFIALLCPQGHEKDDAIQTKAGSPMNNHFGDSRDELLDRFATLLRAYRSPESGQELNAADAFYIYRLLLDRNPDLENELPTLLTSRATFREFVTGVLHSAEFANRSGYLPANKLLMAEVDDFRFWFNTTDREMGVRMALGLYEPRTVEVIKQIIHPGMKCIDLGAQTGLYTCLMAARVGASGRVYAFEPMPSSFELLERNVRENNFQDRVQLYRLAASNRDAMLEASVVSNMYVAARIGSAERVSVEGKRVGDLVTDPIDLIKIDIEGHEPAALEGMRTLIMRNKPVIISEVNEYWLRVGSQMSGAEYVTHLMSLGYQVHSTENLDAPLDAHTLQLAPLGTMDVVALPVEARRPAKSFAWHPA